MIFELILITGLIFSVPSEDIKRLNTSPTYINSMVNEWAKTNVPYIEYIYNQTTNSFEQHDLKPIEIVEEHNDFYFTMYLNSLNVWEHFYITTNEPDNQIQFSLNPDYNNVRMYCNYVLVKNDLYNNGVDYYVFDLNDFGYETIEKVQIKLDSTEFTFKGYDTKYYLINTEYAQFSYAYTMGYENGYNVGYSTGIVEQQTPQISRVFAIFKTIANTFSSWWNIELLPNLTLGTLLLIPIATTLLFFIIKLFKAEG